MRFFIYSACGDGIGIAQWLQDIEGHEVYMYCKDDNFKECGKGLIQHVASVKEGLNKNPETIIFDSSGNGDIADKLIEDGYLVLGAGKFNDLIENDRSLGMEMCKQMGIAVPEYSVFKKMELDKAIKFIEDSGKTYVLKPDNNLALDLTYVSKNPEDMIKYLGWCEAQKLLKGDFLLQEKVDGVEISTEVWFSCGKPLEGANGTMEVKKFMAGNLGPATGCESSIVWPYKSLETPIVSATIAKLFPILEKMKYTGPLDINSIVAPDGTAYFLEFTPRFGYSAIYALMQLMPDDLGNFLIEVASGEAKRLVTENKYGMSLTISVPPYPLNPDKKFNREAYNQIANKRVNGIPDGHFSAFDLKKEKDEYLVAGVLGLVGNLNYSGDSIEEVKNIVYEKVKELEIPDIQYRIDGTARVEEDLPKLKEYGYEILEEKEPENV